MGDAVPARPTAMLAWPAVDQLELFQQPGLQWWPWGSVALSLCTTVHPLYTKFANIFGASLSETTNSTEP